MKLYELSGEIADLYRHTKNGVVQVRQTDEDGEVVVRASGTVWIQTGIIITVSHPFEDRDRIEVIHGSDEPVAARVRGWDNRYDLAVLEIEGTSITPWQEWGELEMLNPGELVLTLGYGEIRSGMVSRMEEEVTNRWAGVLKPCIEVDGTLSPTQAGGPLVNSAGRFVGINSPLPGPAGQTVGYGQLQNLVRDLLTRGNPTPGYLGVKTSPARTRGGKKGAVITQIEPGSPAETAGLMTGDVLLEVAGTRLLHPHRLFLYLRTAKAGDTVEILINRAETELTVPVTLGAAATGTSK